jgi:hypothetical protein
MDIACHHPWAAATARIFGKTAAASCGHVWGGKPRPSARTSPRVLAGNAVGGGWLAPSAESTADLSDYGCDFDVRDAADIDSDTFLFDYLALGRPVITALSLLSVSFSLRWFCVSRCLLPFLSLHMFYLITPEPAVAKVW